MTQEVNTAATNGEVANPYNKNKPWNTQTEDTRPTSDSLFYNESKPPSTSEKAEQTHDWEKRYKDLQPHHEKTARELKEARESLEQLQAQFAARTTDTGETTEVLEPVTETVAEQKQEVVEEGDRVAKLEAELKRLTDDSNKTRQEKALDQIKKQHPDFDELKNSSEFHAWAKTKSEQVQAAIYKNAYDYKSANEALDLYKFESAKAAQQKQTEQKETDQSEDASSLVTIRNTDGQDDGNKPKIWTTSEINRISKSAALLEQYLPEINKAQAEGRIVRG